MFKNNFGPKDYINMYRKYGVRLPIYYFLENHLFDIINKVDTHKRLLKDEFYETPPNFEESQIYMASFKSVIKNTISKIYQLEKDNFKDFTLIDIGSGKGKVLILWKSFLEKNNLQNDIIGIEHNKFLLDISRKNLDNSHKVTLMSGDLFEVNMQYSELKAIYYLYNPFSEKILDKLLNIVNEKSYFIYNNPVFIESFLKNNYKIVAENKGFHPNLNWVILTKT